MKIKDIKIIPFQPYFTEPFKMFGTTQTQLTNDILRIEDSSGRVGYGETVLSPVFSRDTQRDHEFIKGLIGTDLRDLPTIVAATRRKGIEYYAVTFGLDIAFHDLIGRASEVPLYSLLGGRQTPKMRDYATVPFCDVDDTVRRLKQDNPNREVVQMKLGESGIALDEARIDAALRTMSDKQLLLADFNGGLNIADARTVMGNFKDKRLVWEEPCKLFEENERLAQETGAPLLADQCINASKIPRICETKVFYGVTIKPAKTGSLSAARAMRDTCAEANVRVRIDGPWCGPIGSCAILHLAVGAPQELLIASCDMTGPLALKPTQRGGIVFHPSTRISPPDGPGLGFAPSMA